MSGAEKGFEAKNHRRSPLVLRERNEASDHLRETTKDVSKIFPVKMGVRLMGVRLKGL